MQRLSDLDPSIIEEHDMTKTTIATTVAAADLGLALAGPAAAQTAGSTSAAPSPSSGVKTPKSGGNEVSPRPGPLTGKSSSSAMPDRQPRSVSEAGDARPEEKTTRMSGNPTKSKVKTPLSVNEGGDANPMKRERAEGGTSGSTASGTRSTR
jgi:hypothetical protein